jgi:hypothetical protein
MGNSPRDCATGLAQASHGVSMQGGKKKIDNK